MRVLRSQRSAEREPMHSPMQTRPRLWREMPDMVITMVMVMVMVTVMVMGTGTMETLKVFTPTALAKAMITTVAITAVTMGSIKVSKELDSKKLKYLKGKVS